MDRYIIVVPNILEVYSKLWKSPFICLWLVTAVVFTILRLILRKILIVGQTGEKQPKMVERIFFDTLGRLLGAPSSSKLKLHRSESVLLLFLALLYFIATTFYSGFLFGHLLNGEQIPSINSIRKLNESKMPILFTHARDKNGSLLFYSQ